MISENRNRKKNLMLDSDLTDIRFTFKRKEEEDTKRILIDMRS